MVEERIEQKRLCGRRKPGGLYLMSGQTAAPCGRMPVPVETCPVCHGGIKPTRAWTWIDGDAFAATAPTCDRLGRPCATCPMAEPTDLGRCGLLWIGSKFYATPADYTAEVRLMGVSRRIPALPKGLVLYKTWVFLGHRNCIFEGLDPDTGDTRYKPGLFGLFQPTAVEYVVAPDDDEAKLERLAARGITLVRVHRADNADNQGVLFEEAVR